MKFQVSNLGIMGMQFLCAIRNPYKLEVTFRNSFLFGQKLNLAAMVLTLMTYM